MTVRFRTGQGPPRGKEKRRVRIYPLTIGQGRIARMGRRPIQDCKERKWEACIKTWDLRPVRAQDIRLEVVAGKKGSMATTLMFVWTIVIIAMKLISRSSTEEAVTEVVVDGEESEEVMITGGDRQRRDMEEESVVVVKVCSLLVM